MANWRYSKEQYKNQDQILFLNPPIPRLKTLSHTHTHSLTDAHTQAHTNTTIKQHNHTSHPHHPTHTPTHSHTHTHTHTHTCPSVLVAYTDMIIPETLFGLVWSDL